MKKITLSYIIDDNEFVLLMREKQLSDHPAFDQIKTFTNGSLALDEINKAILHNEQLPLLILLDLNMPVMNGWEFLDAISLIPTVNKIPIYLFTATLEVAGIEKAKRYNQIKGFLSKAISSEEIETVTRLFI